MTPLLTITVSANDSEVEVTLDGELDFTTNVQLASAVKPFVGAAAPVVLELSRLNFCDSAGVAALVKVHKSVMTGGGLVLRHPTQRVMQLLQITGLDRVFVIVPA
jgi:anti-sigma B factor antagonist